MYITLVIRFILYGSETWALRKTKEIRLDNCEKKVLR